MPVNNMATFFLVNMIFLLLLVGWNSMRVVPDCIGRSYQSSREASLVAIFVTSWFLPSHSIPTLPHAHLELARRAPCAEPFFSMKLAGTFVGLVYHFWGANVAAGTDMVDTFVRF